MGGLLQLVEQLIHPGVCDKLSLRQRLEAGIRLAKRFGMLMMGGVDMIVPDRIINIVNYVNRLVCGVLLIDRLLRRMRRSWRRC